MTYEERLQDIAEEIGKYTTVNGGSLRVMLSLETIHELAAKQLEAMAEAYMRGVEFRNGYYVSTTQIASELANLGYTPLI